MRQLAHALISRVCNDGRWAAHCRCGYGTAGHTSKTSASVVIYDHIRAENRACPHPVLSLIVHDAGEDFCTACGTWVMKEELVFTKDWVDVPCEDCGAAPGEPCVRR